MNWLRKLLDSMTPCFKEGKLKFFYPFFEAADTFAFTPGTVTGGSVHVRDNIDLKRLMTFVMIALVPCILFGIYNIGHGDILLGLSYFLPLYIVSFVTGVGTEVLFSMIRRTEVSEGVFVSSLILPLIVPATIPLWQVAVGMIFAVVFAKEVFGGTGYNFINPAIAARVFIFFAYPESITGNGIWDVVDGVSTPTILGALQTNAPIYYTLKDAFLGFIPGSIGETSTLICIFSGIFLMVTKIASWRIVFGGILGLVIVITVGNQLGNPENAMMMLSPLMHMSIGGFMFGIVFMATDPVTAPHCVAGHVFYGFFIGAMCALLRLFNQAFPEGMMMAILLGNIVAPLIDYVIVERNVALRRRGYES